MRDTDRPIAFKPWIYEIAKNACIDQFRRSRRAEEISYDAEDGLGSADYGKLVTRDPAPDHAFENKQSLDHLRGAFGGLSETHHQILVMRELEGLSYREIGERLGMTRPAVESTLFRARRRLTEEYDELVTGERCQRVQGIIALAADGALGARDRKRLARHVSYCQPCLRHARVSGLDSRDLVHVPARAKIAAFLPLPAFLKKKLAGAEAVQTPDTTASMAVWSAHASAVDPGTVSGWGKAAMGAATIALAGVGAGAATSPPDAARAGLGGHVLIERVLNGSARGGAGGAAGVARAVPISVPASTSAGATGAGTGTTAKASGPNAVTKDGVKGASGSAAGSGVAAAGAPRQQATEEQNAASAGASDSTGSGTPATADKATGGVKETVKQGPIGEVVGAVTGGGGSTGSAGSTGASGSTGAGAQTQQPEIRLPGVQLPSPSATTGGGSTTPPAGPVGDAVQGATDAVGGVVDGVKGAVGGVSDGVGGILGGQ
jgi:RNA polymerase sigma factor (sigma-70 family)